ncbi:MAG: valine--tRNA ligase [Spirochaetes bacterium]|nr:MAG: valine--tRNA ligase [Spirochaetota bacterium]
MKMAKTYNPREIEDKWYKYWEKSGFFHSEVDPDRKPFTIVIPPPNVTGVLHMGHGLNNTIQDILIRWRRMQGYNTLWVPGTDHAGIATQNVVERQLAKEGKTRHDVGREEFIELVWEWKKKYGSTIINQLKKLGASCDWQRERFTMDEGLSRAVREVFVRLYNEGLIYRGKYIINWCPRCQTALADEEVEHESEKGYLYYIKYPFKDETGELIVATTRPETMLGDTALAVNPDDKRYKKYVGKVCILPLVGRELPVIADDYVDPEFGTGVVKITPAHDPNDFEVGKRHNLEQVNIFNIDASINENGIPECIGMDRYECREVIIEELKKKDFLVKTVPHEHEVGHCYRCHTVIEPWLSEQWFVKMKPLAEPAIKVVEKGKIKFYPGRWKKVYMNWMNNIRDWCISRQIWWGHRIPVYYCNDCGYSFASTETPEKCPKCSGNSLRQDEDVLDTWFSSQLWPFSTLGWPEQTEELKYYYPTDVLVTDPGILFFWVARMIMSGMKFMNEIPFKDVFIHGVVMDVQGRKMSKSLGNGIDPIEVVEKYGADALRYTIINITPLGQNLLLSMDKFEIGARFANKIWNASRYILSNIEGIDIKDINDVELDLADRWILSRYHRTVKKMNDYLEKYRLMDASSLIYEFFWHDFCDWYIEISKVSLYRGREEDKVRVASMLSHILDGSLRLLHPIMPFITEEIWQKLPIKKNKESIMISDYPEYDKRKIDKKSENQLEVLKDLIYNIRNIRGEMHIPPEIKADILVKIAQSDVYNIINQNEEIVKFLAGVKGITIGDGVYKPEGSASAVGSGFEIYIPLKGLINIDMEKARLKKEIQKLEAEIEKSSQKLKNKNFIERAPAEVINKEKEKYNSNSGKLERVKEILKGLD